MGEQAGPLAGVRVVDFGQYIAGPGAAQILADLGADVVKVEPPGGDAARGVGSFGAGIMRGYNRRKRAIAVDLKDQAGAEVARRLVAGADVVVQNLRAGALERLGFGREQVRALNPGVVYVEVNGFGSAGPSRERPGYDIAAQAESGMMSLTGEVDGAPQRVGFVVVDAAAANSAAQAVLAALFRRERTGRGDDIEVSLLGVALHLQCGAWNEYECTGIEPVRRGNGQPRMAPAADIVPTSDGHIMVSAYTDQHWPRLCTVLRRPELADDPRFADNPSRVANRGAMLDWIAASLGGLTSEEAVGMLARGGVVAGVVRTFEQVLRAPDVRDGGFFVPGETPAGMPFHTPVLPYRMASHPVTDAGTPPDFGQHTEDVLRDLGYDDSEIRDLLDDGAVFAAESTESAQAGPLA